MCLLDGWLVCLSELRKNTTNFGGRMGPTKPFNFGANPNKGWYRALAEVWPLLSAILHHFKFYCRKLIKSHEQNSFTFCHFIFFLASPCEPIKDHTFKTTGLKSLPNVKQSPMSFDEFARSASITEPERLKPESQRFCVLFSACVWLCALISRRTRACQSPWYFW